jgi:hypothetical protein
MADTKIMRRGGFLPVAALSAALLLAGGSISESEESAARRALAALRRQDYSPLFDVAAERLQGLFTKDREQAFLDDLLSLSGKWKAATRGEASYRRYVRKLFERTVFGPVDAERLLTQLRADLAYGFAALENRLLVEIEADLRHCRPDLTLPALAGEYRRLSERVAAGVAGDLGMNVVSLVGSEVVSVLGLSALASSGALGPSLAAGGATGAWSLGVGLLLGLGAGLALDWALGDLYEDVARAELRATIHVLRSRLIDEVHATLVAAVLRHREFQEACIRDLFGRRAHGGLVARP